MTHHIKTSTIKQPGGRTTRLNYRRSGGRFALIGLLGAASLLAACASNAPTTGSVGPAASAGAARATGPIAVALLKTPGNTAAGRATFTTVAGGVEVAIEAQGLAPGVHGVHVHANGACARGPDGASGTMVDFGAAGGHFDPGGSHNHGQPGQPMTEVHAGDTPSLQVGSDGRGSLRFLNPNLAVAPGSNSVMGRSLVVHADADDYVSDPAGNSGARVICGVIDPDAPGSVRGRVTLQGAQVFPEGITVDARSGTAYVGSSANGNLYRIASGATEAELFQEGGAPGRQGAFGMKVDERGRLWVAGGPNGTVALVDAATATTMAVWKAPPNKLSFLNDLVLNRDGFVYVTDSFSPMVYRIRNVPAGGSAALEPWLDLSATAVRYVPNEVNFNGIVASADGRYLLAIQLITGQLWRIDTQTRAVTLVRIEGGDLQYGDGLVVNGESELYVMRNAANEIARVRLAAGWASGVIDKRMRDPRLHYPTTAAASANGLMVVNGQLDKQKSPPPLLPFDIVTVDLSKD